jgi:hypothetical protein
MMFTNPLPLDLLDRNGVALGLFFLVLLGIYLVRETARRNISASEWFFRLPPPMNLVLAVMIFDAGVVLRTAGVAAAGGLLLVVGALCKIRAFSRPSWGDGPWLLGIASVLTITLLYFA